jgi:hypothetical protein
MPFHNRLSTAKLRREIELALAVVAQRISGARAGLQPVGAHQRAIGGVFHDEVVADVVEGIGVQAGVVRLHQAFVQLEVEHLEPQRLRRLQVHGGARQACAVGRNQTGVRRRNGGDELCRGHGRSFSVIDGCCLSIGVRCAYSDLS